MKEDRKKIRTMKIATSFLAALLVGGTLGVTASSVRAEQRAQDAKRGSTAEVQEVARADKDSRVRKQDNRDEALTEESWDAHIRELRQRRQEAE
jgi:hypothetical protein